MHAAAEFARGSLDWWTALSRAGEIWWTRVGGASSIASAAAERAARLIAFARARSPIYRDLWDSVPPDRATLDALPPITKRQLMDRFDDWVTDRCIDRAGIDAFLADRAHIGA